MPRAIGVPELLGHAALEVRMIDADRDFLMRGGVFTEDLIEEWLAFKRASAKQVALRPHPYEFYLYSDV